jgi:hypothetical protein
MLPDEALLEIFVFCMDKDYMRWCTLVHVCRKWRNIVFGSPRRLDLQLWCTPGIPVRRTLDIWPPLLPIVVYGYKEWEEYDDMVAALEQNDRVCSIDFVCLSSFQWEKFLAATQQPYPALTSLVLGLEESDTAQTAPDSFLRGSAPRLEELWLNGVPFPGLPTLLFSATHLVILGLHNIPHSGYISPEAMVTCLSVLTRLKTFRIEFESPQSRPDPTGRRPSPLTLASLPVLVTLEFRGVGEYLEDLVAHIDAPLLEHLRITFFHQLAFDTPQLNRFISRTPKFKARGEARVVFSDQSVSVKLPSTQTIDGELELVIVCELLDLQLPSLVQVCRSSFPRAFIPTVENLYIIVEGGFWDLPDDIEDGQWLELLRPFTAVKDLYMSYEITLYIARALKELIGERVTEVLPFLQNLFLEDLLPSGPVQKATRKFLTARQLAGHPITVSRWERN